MTQILVISAADLEERERRMEQRLARIEELLEGRVDGWLSIPDMAAKHGVTRATINAWVRDGRADHEGRRLTAKGSGAARKVRWE